MVGGWWAPTFCVLGLVLTYIKKGACKYNSCATAADPTKIGKAEAYANNAKRTRREREASAKRTRSECEANASLWKWAHRYSQWPQGEEEVVNLAENHVNNGQNLFEKIQGAE